MACLYLAHRSPVTRIVGHMVARWRPGAVSLVLRLPVQSVKAIPTRTRRMSE